MRQGRREYEKDEKERAEEQDWQEHDEEHDEQPSSRLDSFQSERHIADDFMCQLYYLVGY